MNSPHITVILVGKGDSESLRKSLDSLAKQQASKERFELICFFDRAISAPDLFDLYQNKFGNFRLLMKEWKQSYIVKNAGLRLANGETVMIIESGLVFSSPNSLALMSQQFSDHNQILVWSIHQVPLVVAIKRNLKDRGLMFLPNLNFSEGLRFTLQFPQLKLDLEPLVNLQQMPKIQISWNQEFTTGQKYKKLISSFLLAQLFRIKMKSDLILHFLLKPYWLLRWVYLKIYYKIYFMGQYHIYTYILRKPVPKQNSDR